MHREEDHRLINCRLFHNLGLVIKNKRLCNVGCFFSLSIFMHKPQRGFYFLRLMVIVVGPPPYL